MGGNSGSCPTGQARSGLDAPRFDPGRELASLGRRQIELLDRICRTNGGGISGYGLHRSTMRSLEKRGLIQGKRTHESCAVHTREGLDVWRLWKERERVSA